MAEVDELRQQLLDLVSRQHAAEQRQYLAEQALLEERSHREAAQARTDQRTQGSVHMGMVDTRLLGKPERWDGSDRGWKDWRFVTRAYLMAAMPSVSVYLDRAEALTQDIDLPSLDEDGQQVSRQLYYILVLLTSGRALDKVQASGEGEGLKSWRLMHEQWEPRSRSRFTAMLVSILSRKFTGDGQASLDRVREGHP